MINQRDFENSLLNEQPLPNKPSGAPSIAPFTESVQRDVRNVTEEGFIAFHNPSENKFASRVTTPINKGTWE